MTEVVTYDHVILGESVAGAAAAIDLRMSGASVLVSAAAGALHPGSTWEISATPLVAETLDGWNWWYRFLDRFGDLGGHYGILETSPTFRPSLHDQGIALPGLSLWLHMQPWTRIPAHPSVGLPPAPRVVVETGIVVFAPHSSQPDLPPELGAEHLIGHGLNLDAWTDGVLYKGEPVAVVGCGHMAIEQARIMVSYGCSVTIVCEQVSLSGREPLLSEVLAFPQVEVQPGARVVSIVKGERAKLRGIIVQRAGHQQLLGVAGVFLASDPVVDWSWWGGRDGARPFIEAGMLVPAGLAAGVDPTNHTALYRDGQRAARLCLAHAGA